MGKGKSEWAAIIGAIISSVMLIVLAAGQFLNGVGESPDDGTGRLMPQAGELGAVILAGVAALLVVVAVVVNVLSNRKAKKELDTPTEEDEAPTTESPIVATFDAAPVTPANPAPDTTTPDAPGHTETDANSKEQ